jgi:predicted dehydrogenase
MVHLNVAVVGCSEWGRNHARVLDDLTNANLVSIADARASIKEKKPIPITCRKN